MKSPYFVRCLPQNEKKEESKICLSCNSSREEKIILILDNIAALKEKIAKNNSEKKKCWEFHLKGLRRALEREIEMTEFNYN